MPVSSSRLPNQERYRALTSIPKVLYAFNEAFSIIDCIAIKIHKVELYRIHIRNDHHAPEFGMIVQDRRLLLDDLLGKGDSMSVLRQLQ